VEEIKLLKDYKDFEDVFLEARARILVLHYNYNHAIKLEVSKRPPQQPLYSLLIKEIEVLKEYI
jgi:hypothetical protein